MITQFFAQHPRSSRRVAPDKHCLSMVPEPVDAVPARCSGFHLFCHLQEFLMLSTYGWKV